MPSLTVEQILTGTTVGRMQAAGQMAIIPILDDGGSGDWFAPPEFEAGTRNYGELQIRNRSSRETILPTGTAFLTSEAAQDHAAPSAMILAGSSENQINNAYCIQETQGGLIRQTARDFLILPVQLRAFALAHRAQAKYDAMWPHIRAFKQSMGLSGPGNLIEFLKRFEKELEQFVAEFELVPRQVGALIMVAGKLVGIERAPSEAFWAKLWDPLVRVCYGSLALREAVRPGVGLPPTRQPITASGSLEALSRALEAAAEVTKGLVIATVETLRPKVLTAAPQVDQISGQSRVLTLASREYAGQIVTRANVPVYASICAAG